MSFSVLLLGFVLSTGPAADSLNVSTEITIKGEWIKEQSMSNGTTLVGHCQESSSNCITIYYENGRPVRVHFHSGIFDDESINVVSFNQSNDFYFIEFQ
jgi:hypothetical protein